MDYGFSITLDRVIVSPDSLNNQTISHWSIPIEFAKDKVELVQIVALAATGHHQWHGH